MLGDIIIFKDSVETDQTPVPVKVIALGYQHRGNENEALVQIGNDEGNDIVEIDDEFVGYPLTSKILEKNFQEPTDGLSWFPEEGGFNCHTYVPKCEINTFGLFKYVHELQHVLRLCGIDKTIEL